MKKHLLDLVERGGATFAQAFLAVQVADQTNVTQLSSLKVAGFAGLFSVAKFGLIRVNAYLAKPDPTAPVVAPPPAA